MTPTVLLLPALLTGCGLPAGPAADFLITVDGELPGLGPDSVLDLQLHSWTRSVTSGTLIEPDCLFTEPGCAVTMTVGGLGNQGADVDVWLDLDGDDDRDIDRALLDHDLIAAFVIDFDDLPWAEPLEVQLQEPELVFDQ